MGQAVKKEESVFARIDLRHLDGESSSAVMAALQFQHRFFLHEMQGALLPATVALTGGEVMLDVLSGSGSWCMDISHRYPHAQVWGVDTNQALIDLATENGVQGGFRNLHMQRIDDPCAMPFADEMFEVIRIQNGASLFARQQWPRVLAEITRLLKPGGWLTLVDFEMGFVSHPAVDRLLTLFGHMLAKLDRSGVPEGKLPVTGSAFGPHRMARQGFLAPGYHLFAVNLGNWNTLAGRVYLAQCLLRPALILSLAERTGISSSEELCLLLWEMRREVSQLSFCGAGVILSSFGRKPLAPAEGT